MGPFIFTISRSKHSKNIRCSGQVNVIFLPWEYSCYLTWGPNSPTRHEAKYFYGVFVHLLFHTADGKDLQQTLWDLNARNTENKNPRVLHLQVIEVLLPTVANI